ncbi:MAG: hypothetical protein K0Q95_697 [Bacteroidota bacterium]|jgi:hypothetical protein|nr:hypothetical protein [Bacteroidota bacterium]
MRTSTLRFLTLGLVTALTFSACKKDKDEEPTPTNPSTPAPSYNVPLTYSFSNVDYTTSTQRLAMLSEITTYIRTTHSATAAPILDAQKLKDMFENVNNQFTDATLNTSGISLKEKSSNEIMFNTALDANFNDAVTASTNASANPTASTAYNGYAGKLISGTRYILVDTAGIEYKEFAEKGIMGSVLYSQAMTILNSIATFDNVTVNNGRTAQEQVWDEAFGYFGVPIDFPTNTVGLKNWGSYCNSVSNALGGTPTVNKTIMDAWLKGRAAISNKDNAGRDAAKATIVATWEKVVAARFISYVKSAKTNASAQASFNHNLSEAIGFINDLKYNPAKTISDADLNLLTSYFQTAGTINLYTVTITNLDNAINKMAFLFNLDASLL